MVLAAGAASVIVLLMVAKYLLVREQAVLSENNISTRAVGDSAFAEST
jgi:hypothetical protein